ncbi:hypothetical protein LCGC14_1960490, partial [marine sediment metagenome]
MVDQELLNNIISKLNEGGTVTADD